MADWDEFQREIRDATDEELRGMKRAGSQMVEHCVNKEMSRRARTALEAEGDGDGNAS